MRCGICHHVKRVDIEHAVATGVGVLDAAVRFGVSRNALAKHVATHPVLERHEPPSPPATAPGHTAAAPIAVTARAQIDDVMARIRRLVDQAENDPDATYRDRATLFTASSTAIKLLGQLTGELGASEATIAASPHWKRLRKAIVDALRPYPEAARAVLEVVERTESVV